jgi:hypothetical protein
VRARLQPGIGSCSDEFRPEWNGFSLLARPEVMRTFRCGMFDDRLVGNGAMATAVSAGLTRTTLGMF